jgi:hypothetical protein
MTGFTRIPTGFARLKCSSFNPAIRHRKGYGVSSGQDFRQLVSIRVDSSLKEWF